ncbi:winged helix-turn-helix domain-containing tetratricopeptide repeat protein [Caenimonas soli]|uniref:winged helix-turn-helix domain-containing tetratricopeptide repeat protein n=1 Tax=Caenimonas soli TaxID=2735555 RepID=UPI001552E5A2|nr:winged helix-turn-helix domain-containing protein [Caenimonas soli]NPC54615.1 transcriptional regulator [Caenimonas soli]
MAEECFELGPFTLDAGRAILLRDGTPVSLGHRAAAVLVALVRANGRVLSKAELIDAAWPDAVVEESNLSVQISALRRVLGTTENGGDFIATVSRIGYRFCFPVSVQPPAFDIDPGSSIVVLPLLNLTGNPEQEYVADGITEDIMMALSRFRWFQVIGRSASFAFKGDRLPTREVAGKLGVRYALEGSLRKSADGLAIAVQLTDAPTETQLWSARYELAAGDLGNVHDTIAHQVAGAVEPELLKSSSSQVQAGGTATATARDLVHRGTWLFHQVTRSGHLQARDLFREACHRDPASGQAHFWLARVSAGIVAYGWSDAPERDLREGLEAAAGAIRLDGKNPYAHYAVAITSVYAQRFDTAIRAATVAAELAPGFALGHLVLGMARLFSGDAPGAQAALTRGLHLNAFDPQNFVWYVTLAYAHLFAGNPVSALQCARSAQGVRPDWAPALQCEVCCHVALQDEKAAGRCSLRLASLDRPSDATAGDALRLLWECQPQWGKQLRDWLGVAASRGSSPRGIWKPASRDR